VTEAEWLACNDPQNMLEFLWGKASERKLRLFAIACCRSSRQLLLNKDFRKALDVSTRYADGQATAEELAAAFRSSNGLAVGRIYECSTERDYHRWAEATAVANATAVTSENYSMESHAKDAVWMIVRAAHRNPERYLCRLLRDVFGNLFHPISPAPAVLTWNDGTVVRLAQAAYDERQMPAGTLDKGRLAVLADGLEEAGCTSEDILGHLRGPGTHVRGCWPVDLCLGKS
jgi:hypothetical protein